jgi:4-diphosphocytidyl-2-C-methyl-D-erythritol kinase
VSESRAAVAVAPAKVNLVLDVLGRRPDGYHEIDSELVALALSDLVYARRREQPGVELVVRGPAASADVTSGPTNLVARAAQLVLADVERAGPARGAGLALELVKHVPSRAGLGGASSDAAAALFASADALGLPLTRTRAAELLASLGSDTVFFAEARFTGHARLRGRGEHVEVLPPLAPLHVAIVVPPVGCPTPDVYRRYAERGGRERSGPNERNALAAAAFDAVPVLAAWRAALDARFALSGSGSAFFALHERAAAAHAHVEETRTSLAARGLVGAQCFVTRTIDAAAHLVASAS